MSDWKNAKTSFDETEKYPVKSYDSDDFHIGLKESIAEYIVRRIRDENADMDSLMEFSHKALRETMGILKVPNRSKYTRKDEMIEALIYHYRESPTIVQELNEDV